METRIIVDTDIIIDYLKKRQPGAELLKKAYLKYSIHVTSITVYELLYGVQKNGRVDLINRLLRYVTIIPFDDAAARKAAAIHYALKSKGMDIGIKDSFIAGICEAHNMSLLTGNLKHFNRIPSLKLLSFE
ncbi:MAG: type II toxin-antitoxin system VapC family toxin [Deltaproteobacteria bacterium]|nr:type II toxin-antitoxin system VapC family toxin [Deltaproteobacteria bacterium]